jgi:hypothetical protein
MLRTRSLHIGAAFSAVAIGLVFVTLVIISGSSPETAAQSGGGESFADAIPAEADAAGSVPQPFKEIAESGRLQFYVLADAVTLDENGEINGGYALHQTCEADAVVRIGEGGRIAEVIKAGIAESSVSISMDETIVGQGFHQGLPDGAVQNVYRDENGDVHTGCDPDSWIILKTE